MDHDWDDLNKRTNLSIFFSDFMDSLCDYETGHYTRTEFRDRLSELNDIYRLYPTADAMYKATMQRLISVMHFIDRSDALKQIPSEMKESEGKWQVHWISQEQEIIKHPPKIIF